LHPQSGTQRTADRVAKARPQQHGGAQATPNTRNTATQTTLLTNAARHTPKRSLKKKLTKNLEVSNIRRTFAVLFENTTTTETPRVGRAKRQNRFFDLLVYKRETEM